jgi:hypothetical protein
MGKWVRFENEAKAYFRNQLMGNALGFSIWVRLANLCFLTTDGHR